MKRGVLLRGMVCWYELIVGLPLAVRDGCVDSMLLNPRTVKENRKDIVQSI